MVKCQIAWQSNIYNSGGWSIISKGNTKPVSATYNAHFHTYGWFLRLTMHQINQQIAASVPKKRIIKNITLWINFEWLIIDGVIYEILCLTSL